MANTIYPVGTKIKLKKDYPVGLLPEGCTKKRLEDAIGIKENHSISWYFPNWEAAKIGHSGGTPGAEYGRWYIDDQYVEPINTKKLEDYM